MMRLSPLQEMQAAQVERAAKDRPYGDKKTYAPDPKPVKVKKPKKGKK